MALRPPHASGMPIHPAVTEKKARITSGTTIVAGDSWMCAVVSSSARQVPWNVRKRSRNM